MDTTCLHASCVALDGRGVLLVGPSGAGKSDLAAQLVFHGAELVADDQVILKRQEDGRLEACAPQALAGLIELRSVGLLRLPYRACAPLALYVELVVDSGGLERLPEPAFISLLDCPVRWLKLAAWQASTPAIIALALQGKLLDV